jgi:hypothetical protein
VDLGTSAWIDRPCSEENTRSLCLLVGEKIDFENDGCILFLI